MTPMTPDTETKVADKNSPVKEQLEVLGKTKEKLSATIDRLEERLSSVLFNDSADKSEATPKQDLTPLAGAIRDNEESFSYQNRRLYNIIERLELYFPDHSS